MKLHERTPERVVFGLTAREKDFLERLLSFYPLGQDLRPVLTRERPGSLPEAEALLQESLKEHQAETVAWLRLHLAEGEAIRKASHGWRLTLFQSDIDRLLQVFNELRVSAWMKLGSPEEIADPALASAPGDEPYFAIMTLAGQFEMALIHSLGPPAGDAGASPAG